ncbi:MAG: 3'-5' exonuclease [Burkholderiales bacterium]
MRDGLIGRIARRLRGEDAFDPRVVVLDTETSGLDPQRDELLAIGAVAVDATGIRVEDSFETVVRPSGHVSRDSVVVHGIGGESQRSAAAPRDALAAFAAYAGDAPIVAFHASFDRAVLERAFEQAGVTRPSSGWLDAAHLAATLFPEDHKRGTRALDDWLSRFAIGTLARHTAAGDAAATAELFLRLRALAAREGHRSHASLARFAQRHRWL